MIEFIIDNYKIILGVIIFLIFSVIGYVIDTVKNKSEEKKDDISFIPEEDKE